VKKQLGGLGFSTALPGTYMQMCGYLLASSTTIVHMPSFYCHRTEKRVETCGKTKKKIKRRIANLSPISFSILRWRVRLGYTFSVLKTSTAGLIPVSTWVRYAAQTSCAHYLDCTIAHLRIYQAFYYCPHLRIHPSYTHIYLVLRTENVRFGGYTSNVAVES
jgi:hypothetical protein